MKENVAQLMKSHEDFEDTIDRCFSVLRSPTDLTRESRLSILRVLYILSRRNHLARPKIETSGMRYALPAREGVLPELHYG
jgi:hypothetical protein